MNRYGRRLLACTALTVGWISGQTLPSINSVANGGAFDSRLAPGCLAHVFGRALGIDPSISVTVGGRPAAVAIALPSQLEIEIPVDLPAGPTTIQVGNTAALTINLTPYAPGLISRQGQGPGIVQAVHSQTGDLVDIWNPAVGGESLSVFAVGLGPTIPTIPTGTPAPLTPPTPTTASPSITIGGISAAVQFAGAAPAQVGVYQVQFTLPASVPGGRQPIVLSVGGMDSPSLLLPVMGVPPVPVITSVVNGASFSTAPLAPGSIATVFGANFGAVNSFLGFPATSFNGLSVTFNGIKAPLVAVVASVGQINLVLPSELPESGTVQVAVITNNGSSVNFPITMVSAAPGVFVTPSFSNPQRRTATILFANTAWAVMPAALAQELKIPGNCHASGIPARAICSEPAQVGNFVQIYATGLGKATPNGDPAGTPLPTGASAPANGNPLYQTVAQPNVTIGGVSASVSFSGIVPGFAGYYQVNVQVPAGAPAGDDVPISVTMPNGLGDSTATMAIRQ